MLAHFGADPREWSVVFTSGATAALKLVGEQFPWTSRSSSAFGGGGSLFVHARASHNSVLGVRAYAQAGGASVRCIDIDDYSCRSDSLRDDFVEPSNSSCCRCSSCCDCTYGVRASPPEGAVPRSGKERGVGRDGDWVELEERGTEEERGNGAAQKTGRDRSCCLRAIARGNEEDLQRSPADEVDGKASNDDDSDCCARINSCGSCGRHDGDGQGIVDCLFAFPAECNATGVRSDLSIAGHIKRSGLMPSGSCKCAIGCVSSSCSSCCEGGDSCRDFTSARRSASCRASEDNSPRDIVKNCVGVGDDRPREDEPVEDTQPTLAAKTLLVAAEDGRAIGRRSMAAGQQPGEGVGCGGHRRRRRVRRWWVMLDAAKLVGTAPLDLSDVEADFVAVSFYKMFG